MASFNKIDNNFARDTLIVTIGNCLTSFFSGFVIFGMLGAMAKITGQSVEDLTDSGPGLVFMSYPSAIALFPGKQFWAVLFFLMLITLAWDSQAVLVEAVVAGIIDYWPKLKQYRIYVLSSVCTIAFLIGLIITAPGGMIWFNVLGDYSANHGFILVVVIFVIGVYTVYGTVTTKMDMSIKNFTKNTFDEHTKLMLKKLPFYHRYYYWPMLYVITPVLLLFIFIYTMVSWERASMGVGYFDDQFPLGNETYIFQNAPYAFCIIVDFLPLTVVVFMAIYAVNVFT